MDKNKLIMKIIWVDDDINISMKPFVDELRDNNHKVIKVNHPDKFLKKYFDMECDLLIMDIMMPLGFSLTREETKFGHETGVALIKKYKLKYPERKIIIFSIVGDDNIRKISSDLGLPYKSKRKTNPKQFREFITNNHA